jgi:hypothetical protein
VNTNNNILIFEFPDRSGLPARASTFTVIGSVHKGCQIFLEYVLKKIPLTKGQFAAVDDDDDEKVSAKKWTELSGYAVNTRRLPGINKIIILGMHRFVMGLPIGEKSEIDHIDGDRLNNQKANLRICTRSQNMMNKRVSDNSISGYKGVRWCEGKWRVTITKNGNVFELGRFFCLIKAAKAYDKAAIKHHGEFARLNFP